MARTEYPLVGSEMRKGKLLGHVMCFQRVGLGSGKRRGRIAAKIRAFIRKLKPPPNFYFFSWKLVGWACRFWVMASEEERKKYTTWAEGAWFSGFWAELMDTLYLAKNPFKMGTPQQHGYICFQWEAPRDEQNAWGYNLFLNIFWYDQAWVDPRTGKADTYILHDEYAKAWWLYKAIGFEPPATFSYRICRVPVSPSFVGDPAIAYFAIQRILRDEMVYPDQTVFIRMELTSSRIFSTGTVWGGQTAYPDITTCPWLRP